ncbi:carbohydrate ABC transporter permease [Paenibacillus nasutitermitis]|uniref:ABC transporter permease protein YtcP n=1 Tax=Paenibacillus nasutitermitis TaxID=1652958 RepID=A0A916YNR2_9BACL|nr:carbohydrate ABC transporter permease [Paenibacillus nasutitermitis]GGD53517.1 putative ABC transporter permease protein YtcP [Paenibacillus nasutitermitis]
MKMTWPEKIFQLLLVLGLSLMCLTMLYPFLHQLTLSLSADAPRLGISLIPKKFAVSAYSELFKTKEIWTALYNSVFRTVIGTIMMVAIMSAAAYALSKRGLPHRKFYTMFIVITMFFSGGLLPTYLLVQNLGLLDSRWALILPCLVNTFWLIIIRNFFMELSEEIEESAKIDGANDIRIFVGIVLPVSMPIIATMTLFCAVFHWNAWFDALLYAQDQKQIVLQIYLRRLIVSQDDSMLTSALMSISAPPKESLKAAVLVFTTLPILLVYPFLQKYFTKGILVGSVKG